MTGKTRNLVRKPLAQAIVCSALGFAPLALAGVVEDVNTDNLAVPPLDGQTLIYTDAVGTATFGWLDPVNDSGEIGLGISVYNEAFSGNVDDVDYDFAGCIMAQPDLAQNCTAPGDSGKRFKLKTTEINGPIDLVFNVTEDTSTRLYRVIGKFSNLTTGSLEAFRFETGFGTGSGFVRSTAEDGLSFGFLNDDSAKLSVGPVGKYPGGLFGGSRVEGLPFFSTSIASFSEGTTTLSQDALETDGTIPAPYAALFGDWQPLSAVPTGWFIDHDGNPANDSILLAWNAGTEATPDWKTFEKVFNAVVTVDHDGDDLTAEISADNWDPNSVNFDPAVAGNVAPLVATIGEGDEDDQVPDAISLVEDTAAGLYDGVFKVLIDGEAVTIDPFADWAANPPTVENTGDNSTYATWFADEGDDGMYQLASDASWVTLEEMTAEIAGSAGALDWVPGYVQGAVEDLANVNVNTSIQVAADTSSWPTCTGDGVSTNCTFTIRVTGINDAVEVPTISGGTSANVDSDVATSGSGSDSTPFGCTTGRPGAPVDPVLPGLVLMALAGLWARKRTQNA